jgi:hypothetical protein
MEGKRTSNVPKTFVTVAIFFGLFDLCRVLLLLLASFGITCRAITERGHMMRRFVQEFERLTDRFFRACALQINPDIFSSFTGRNNQVFNPQDVFSERICIFYSVGSVGVVPRRCRPLPALCGPHHV